MLSFSTFRNPNINGCNDSDVEEESCNSCCCISATEATSQGHLDCLQTFVQRHTDPNLDKCLLLAIEELHATIIHYLINELKVPVTDDHIVGAFTYYGPEINDTKTKEGHIVRMLLKAYGKSVTSVMVSRVLSYVHEDMVPIIYNLMASPLFLNSAIESKQYGLLKRILEGSNVDVTLEHIQLFVRQFIVDVSYPTEWFSHISFHINPMHSTFYLLANRYKGPIMEHSPLGVFVNHCVLFGTYELVEHQELVLQLQCALYAHNVPKVQELVAKAVKQQIKVDEQILTLALWTLNPTLISCCFKACPRWPYDSLLHVLRFYEQQASSTIHVAKSMKAKFENLICLLDFMFNNGYAFDQTTVAVTFDKFLRSLNLNNRQDNIEKMLVFYIKVINFLYARRTILSSELPLLVQKLHVFFAVALCRMDNVTMTLELVTSLLKKLYSLLKHNTYSFYVPTLQTVIEKSWEQGLVDQPFLELLQLQLPHTQLLPMFQHLWSVAQRHLKPNQRLFTGAMLRPQMEPFFINKEFVEWVFKVEPKVMEEFESILPSIDLQTVEKIDDGLSYFEWSNAIVHLLKVIDTHKVFVTFQALQQILVTRKAFRYVCFSSYDQAKFVIKLYQRHLDFFGPVGPLLTWCARAKLHVNNRKYLTVQALSKLPKDVVEYSVLPYVVLYTSLELKRNVVTEKDYGFVD